MGKRYGQLGIEERTMIQVQLEMRIKPAAIALGASTRSTRRSTRVRPCLLPASSYRSGMPQAASWNNPHPARLPWETARGVAGHCLRPQHAASRDRTGQFPNANSPDADYSSAPLAAFPTYNLRQAKGEA